MKSFAMILHVSKPFDMNPILGRIVLFHFVLSVLVKNVKDIHGCKECYETITHKAHKKGGINKSMLPLL